MLDPMPQSRCQADAKDVALILTDLYSCASLLDQASDCSVEEFAAAHVEFLCRLLDLTSAPTGKLIENGCKEAWGECSQGRISTFACLSQRSISQARNSHKSVRTGAKLSPAILRLVKKLSRVSSQSSLGSSVSESPPPKRVLTTQLSCSSVVLISNLIIREPSVRTFLLYNMLCFNSM